MYVQRRVVKPDVDLFSRAQRASSDHSSHIHHCLYCLIEIKKINLAEEPFANRQNVVAKQTEDPSQIHMFNKQNKSSARFENLHSFLKLDGEYELI